MLSELDEIKCCLHAQRHFLNKTSITVSGKSMEPFLHQNDVVEIVSLEKYVPGDILVFFYKGQLLIHRLLRYTADRYWCKGDNSLRMEDVAPRDVTGKVTSVNGHEVAPMPPFHLQLSALVNRQFRNNRFDVSKTQSSGIYKFYMQSISGIKNDNILYSFLDYEMRQQSHLKKQDPRYTELELYLLRSLESSFTYKEVIVACQNARLSFEEEYPQRFLAKFISLGLIIPEHPQ